MPTTATEVVQNCIGMKNHGELPVAGQLSHSIWDTMVCSTIVKRLRKLWLCLMYGVMGKVADLRIMRRTEVLVLTAVCTGAIQRLQNPMAAIHTGWILHAYQPIMLFDKRP